MGWSLEPEDLAGKELIQFLDIYAEEEKKRAERAKVEAKQNSK